MPLITCPSCEKRVSAEARSCPACGHPMPRRGGVIRTMSIVGIVIAAIGMFYMGVFMDEDADAAVGWGFIVAIWTIAQSITALVSLKRL